MRDAKLLKMVFGMGWWPMGLRGQRDGALVADVEGPSAGLSRSRTVGC